MSSSLRDQLLKAGLVSEQQVREAESQRRRDGKRVAKQRKGKRAQQPSEAARRAVQARTEAAQRDRELNQRIEAEREREARRAQARQLIEKHQLNRPDAALAHNFVVGKRVKRIYVTDEQHAALVAGKLAIASTRGRYYLIPTEIAARLEEVFPEALVRGDTPTAAPAAGEDDPYAEFKVPDDLMW